MTTDADTAFLDAVHKILLPALATHDQVEIDKALDGLGLGRSRAVPIQKIDLSSIAKLLEKVKELPAIVEETKRLTAEIAFAKASPGRYRMHARVAEMRAKDPALVGKTDAAVIAKIATSRKSVDVELWQGYRAEVDGVAKDMGDPGVNQFDLPGATATAQFNALVSDHHAKARLRNPNAHQGHSVAAVMATPKGKALYQQLRDEHMAAFGHMRKSDDSVDEADLQRTVYGKDLCGMFDGQQNVDPKMSRAEAIRRTMMLDGAQTLLRRHRQKLAGQPLIDPVPAPHRNPLTGDLLLKADSTSHGKELVAMIDGIMAKNPGMTRAKARARAIASDRGGTLLVRHEAALRHSVDT